MKKIKSLFLIVLSFLLIFSLISCKKNKEDKEYVKIQSLSAERNISQRKNLSSRKNRILYETSVEETHTHVYVDGVCECGEKDPDYIVEGLIPKGQYVIMYKSESEIQFTITLDNPKGESIDAIELTCDDPNSQIMMDGKYENIHYNNNSIIVNWSQENPYKKTYQIKTTSEESIQILKVLDIKVNGEWQNKELNNDELKIYKIDEDDLSVKTVRNTTEYYEFKVNSSKNISSFMVIFNEHEISPENNGNYRISEDGTVIVRYTYSFNGTDIEWENEYTINLMKFVFWWDDPQYDRTDEFLNTFQPGRIALSFTGTDVDIESIIIRHLNKDAPGEYTAYKSVPGFYENGSIGSTTHFNWRFSELFKDSYKNGVLEFNGLDRFDLNMEIEVQSVRYHLYVDTELYFFVELVD